MVGGVQQIGGEAVVGDDGDAGMMVPCVAGDDKENVIYIYIYFKGFNETNSFMFFKFLSF